MTEAEIVEELEKLRWFLGLEEDFEIRLGPESIWLLAALGIIERNQG